MKESGIYSTTTFNNHGVTLYVVEISHPMCASYTVFSNAEDADDFIYEAYLTLDNLRETLGRIYPQMDIFYKSEKANLFSLICNHKVYTKFENA